MTELEKIIDDVKVSVAKNTAMEEEFNQKAEELRDKCVDNYNTIIRDTLNTLHSLAEKLCYNYGVWFNCSEEEEKTEHFFIKYYGDNDDRFYIEIKADDYYFRPYHYSNNTEWKDDIRNIYISSRNKDKLMAFADILSTEDRTNALLAEISELYAKLFTEILKKVDEDNEVLSGQLTSLTEYLNNSSVVKEEEDGTIEIHLNGKTYRGTVVEE